MATETAELLVKISATTELLRQQMIAAESTVARSTAAMQNSIDRVDKGFGSFNKSAGLLAGGFKVATGAAIGFLAAISVGSIVEASRRALEYAGSLGEAAQKLGVGTKFLQEFRFAATQNGSSIEGADNALAKFNVTLGKAFNGDKASADSFKKLGLSLKDLATDSDRTRYEKTADAIAKIGDDAVRTASKQSLFGKGFKEVGALLDAGAAGFNEAATEAQRFGLVLSDSQIQNSDKVADKISALNQALSAKIAGVVGDNAEAIGQLVNALGDLAVWAVKAGQQFIGFANIMRSRGVLSALATVDGNQLARAATPVGRADLAVSNIKNARDDVQRDRAALQAMNPNLPDSDTTKRGAIDRLNRSTARLRAARLDLKQAGADVRASNAPIPSAEKLGSANVVDPDAGKKGPKGKSQAEIDAKFVGELERANIDILRAKQSMSREIVEHSALEREIVTDERDRAKAAISANKDYSDTQKATLLAAIDRRALIEFDAINHAENVKVAEETLRISQAANENETDLLRSSLLGARTAKTRRELELKLLDLAYQRQRAEIEATLASTDATEAEKKIAAARLAILDKLQSGDRADVLRKTAGPLEQFRDEIPKTAQEINEAFESIEARGLQSLNDGLTDAITGARSLGDVFSNIADQIISDLIRIAVQQAIVGPLANLLGLGGGSGLGLSFGKILGFANGGNPPVGQVSMVGERGPELFVPKVPGTIISNDNLRTGGGDYYDLRGAVVTEQLYSDMQRIAAASGRAAAVAGADLAGARASVSAARRFR